mmetsp:Transcript_9775/g.23515  ORF Transcript_9775/g.23515 Transcript_9775/m.23515 type:complete len:227 (-) Transcript_9775:1128-1808(-)
MAAAAATAGAHAPATTHRGAAQPRAPATVHGQLPTRLGTAQPDGLGAAWRVGEGLCCAFGFAADRRVRCAGGAAAFRAEGVGAQERRAMRGARAAPRSRRARRGGRGLAAAASRTLARPARGAQPLVRARVPRTQVQRRVPQGERRRGVRHAAREPLAALPGSRLPGLPRGRAAAAAAARSRARGRARAVARTGGGAARFGLRVGDDRRWHISALAQRVISFKGRG